MVVNLDADISQALEELNSSTLEVLTRTQQRIQDLFHLEAMQRWSLNAIRFESEQENYLCAGLVAYHNSDVNALVSEIHSGPQRYVLDQLDVAFCQVRPYVNQKYPVIVYVRSSIMTDPQEIQEILFVQDRALRTNK